MLHKLNKQNLHEKISNPFTEKQKKIRVFSIMWFFSCQTINIKKDPCLPWGSFPWPLENEQIFWHEFWPQRSCTGGGSWLLHQRIALYSQSWIGGWALPAGAGFTSATILIPGHADHFPEAWRIHSVHARKQSAAWQALSYSLVTQRTSPHCNFHCGTFLSGLEGQAHPQAIKVLPRIK